jgi:hypothetical protein
LSVLLQEIFSAWLHMEGQNDAIFLGKLTLSPGQALGTLRSELMQVRWVCNQSCLSCSNVDLFFILPPCS